MQMNVLDVFFFNIEHVLADVLVELGGYILFRALKRSLEGKQLFCSADCSSTELPKARGPSTKVRGRWGLATLA